jgi:hypothetical protein
MNVMDSVWLVLAVAGSCYGLYQWSKPSVDPVKVAIPVRVRSGREY